MRRRDGKAASAAQAKHDQAVAHPFPHSGLAPKKKKHLSAAADK
jgi:hypothetical protein